MHLSTLKVLLVTLPITSGVFGHVERATCTGASQDGYCCDGSILKKDNSNDYSAAAFICCQGDPNIQVLAGNNAPTSCTAGTQIPLTQASSGGPSVSTGSSTGSSGASSSASSANAAVRAMMTTAPLMGVAALAGGVYLGM